jgi:hypothetical protein
MEAADLIDVETGRDQGQERAVPKAYGPAVAQPGRIHPGEDYSRSLGTEGHQARSGDSGLAGAGVVRLRKEVVAPAQVSSTMPVSPWRCLASLAAVHISILFSVA